MTGLLLPNRRSILRKIAAVRYAYVAFPTAGITIKYQDSLY